MKLSTRLCLTGLAVTGLFLPISTAGAAPPSGPTTATAANGVAVSSLAQGSSTVKVAGDASIISATSDANSATASVALNIDKAGGITTAAAVRAPSGANVVDLAVAMGMPRAAAERQFGSLAASAASKGGPRGLASAQPGGVGRARPAAIGGGTYFGQACASLSGDNGHLTSYGCSVVFLDWAVTGDWWLAYETSASAASTINRIWSHPFTGFQMVTITPNPGNILVKWAPTGVIYPPTNCTTKTWSVTSPQTGIGYSESGTSCADSVAPVIQWNPYVIYGTHWSGVNFRAGFYEGLNYTHLIHSPYGANPGSFVSLSLWWY